MKNITLIKNLFLLLLITVMLSCNSDDDASTPVENENNLILRTIIFTEGNSKTFEYNERGYPSKRNRC